MNEIIEVIDSELVPELDELAISAVSGLPEKSAMHRLFIADALVWMHLGVEIGVFPMDAAIECFNVYFGPFFESLRPEEPKDVIDTPGSYVSHSNESWRLLNAFPRFSQVLIEKAMRGESGLFLDEQSLFSYPDRLIPVFQSLSILRDQLRRNAVRAFVRALNFFSSAEWATLWDRDCSPDDVARAEAIDHQDPDKACVICGYLILYRYGLHTKYLLETFSPRLDSTDMFKVTNRLREMSKWIINLSSRVSSDRLALVQTEVVERLERQATGNDARLVSAVQRSMEESLGFIGVPMFVLVH
jgi:hypothetical protein